MALNAGAGAAGAAGEAAAAPGPEARIRDFTLCTTSLRMLDYRRATAAAVAPGDGGGGEGEASDDARWLRAHAPRRLGELARQPYPGADHLVVRVPCRGAEQTRTAEEAAGDARETATTEAVVTGAVTEAGSEVVSEADVWSEIAESETLAEAEHAAGALAWQWRERREPPAAEPPAAEPPAAEPPAAETAEAERGWGEVAVALRVREPQRGDGAARAVTLDWGEPGRAGRSRALTAEQARSLETRWEQLMRETPEYEWVDRLVHEVVRAFVCGEGGRGQGSDAMSA